MPHDPFEYEAMFERAQVDRESLTVLLVAGGTVEEVLRVLGAEAVGTDRTTWDEAEFSAYVATTVQGGVVALEQTGYADPSNQVLVALSTLGGSAAVTRSNIQAHERFGCASGGVLLFDADSFDLVTAEKKRSVPAALRPMFDSVWVDMAAYDEQAEDPYVPAGFVGFAMAAAHTGVVVTEQDLRRAFEQDLHPVRSLTYPD